MHCKFISFTYYFCNKFYKLDLIMKKNMEYLASLRQIMKNQGVDAVIISGTDPHQSENPPRHWRGREWITSFESDNGTNGTAVVLADKAYCWTDSRYFIQATDQLRDTGFEMMKEDGPDAVNLIDWVTENLPAGATVAIDGMTFSVSWAQRLQQELNDNNIKLNDTFTFFDQIWPDRPARPNNKLFVHDEEIVGETVDSKVSRLNTEVKAELANAVLLSSLDDIAWVTNLRTANDIGYSPVFVAYLYIDENRRTLFVDADKLTPEVNAHLAKYNFEVKPYESVLDFVAQLPKETRLLVDPAKTARLLYEKISCTPVFGGSRLAKLKSVKNDTMVSHLKTAMQKDGVALVKFFMEVEKEYPSGTLTEYGLGKLLRQCRLADPTCVDESFASIIGWNAHGAIVHYEATPETDIPVTGNGLLLVDSGGQYIYGTTDITRTIALGEVSDKERHDYTLVLKGHIALAMARYPKGTRGTQLDVLARQYLWNEGKAYYHGTGHGVGFFINVHEGPQGIRMNDIPVALEPGMITSNEPGLYLEGEYGIRLENLIVTRPWQTTEFGEFYDFETITLFPFDSSLIEKEILTPTETAWLNDYHAKVLAELSPLLNPTEQAWLVAKCAKI